LARKFVINIAIADLRNKAEILTPDYSHQELRETQLLFGEKLKLLEEQGEWLKIAALEQPFCHGWVHRSEVKEVTAFEASTHVICAKAAVFAEQILSYGTLLSNVESSPLIRKLPKHPIREVIVEDAKLFLGAPYLWGGRAFPLEQTISSVDCSGLINLLYRAQGLQIPRNAHEQYLKSRPTNYLKPGDPLYLAKEKRVNHVVLKLDDKTFIESPETGKCVRLLTWGKEIWEERGRIHIFDRAHSYVPYPGTFILS
jgi:gamma-D-glutamyl-L-lysine dipeptidyl-peptidase